MSGDEILFTHAGSFSGINASLVQEMNRQFDGYSINTVDMVDLLRQYPGFSRARNYTEVSREFGRELLLRQRSVASCFYKTTYAQKCMSKALFEAFGYKKHAFTFQTQVLFNGALPGTPHFIYTDCVSMAPVQCKEWTRRHDYPRHWIDHETSILQRAAGVFTMSHCVGSAITSRHVVPAKKIVCVYGGPNVSRREECAKTRRSNHIVFVGRSWERKGGPQLLKAFTVVRRICPTATLTIAGCRPSVSVEGVEICGECGCDELRNLYSSATIFCVPTLRECFGIVVIEAMHYGLPIVTTPIGALPELITHEDSGYFVAPGSVAQIVEALCRLIGDTKMADNLGKRAAFRARRRFTWEKVVSEMRYYLPRQTSTL